MELLVGTDVQLCTAANSLAEARAAPWPVYKPNLHVEAYDRIFHGAWRGGAVT